MQAPAFWQTEPLAWQARALWPVAQVWGQIAGARMDQPGTRVSAPVICVGNFTAGGAGKTPTVLALAAMLQAQGFTPAFVSRGYGGRLGAEPVQVDPAHHTAAEVGDEPLLLAACAPTFVARDRVAGAMAAIGAGANVIVLDDGLQNPKLTKSLSLAVVDGSRGLGNGLCLPAGPLRAPVAAQWPHVAGVVVIGAGAAGASAADQARQRGVPVFSGVLAPDPDVARHLKGQKVVAFAGIGYPSKFYATLQTLGADVVATQDFADHATMALAALEALADKARRMGAVLVTTQKDAVRMGPRVWAALACERAVLPVTLTLAEPDSLRQLLQTAL